MDDFMDTTKRAGHTHELKRLSDNHAVFKDSMKTLIFVPIDLSKPGKTILDSATADGKIYLSNTRCITN
jgi:hypothetical protein